MKKKMLFGTLGLSLLMLTACSDGNKEGNNKEKDKVTEEIKATEKTKVTEVTEEINETAEENKDAWDETKDKQLQSFISSWQDTMGQTYEKFDGNSSLQTNVGTTYPDSLSKVIVGNESGVVGWSPNGEDKYKYNVVAIYNYNAIPMGRITYFFSLSDGKPVVLVDRATNGEDIAVETQNAEIKEAFEDIVNSELDANMHSETATNHVSEDQALKVLNENAGSLGWMASDRGDSNSVIYEDVRKGPQLDGSYKAYQLSGNGKGKTIFTVTALSDNKFKVLRQSGNLIVKNGVEDFVINPANDKIFNF